MNECGSKCEVFSRVTGYFRPVRNWNDGKREEFRLRKTYSESKALKKELKTEACGCEAKNC